MNDATALSAPAPAPKQETENDRRRAFGIPRWLKRYHARYGKGGVGAIATVHTQLSDVPMLDHWRDRAEKLGSTRPYPSTKPGWAKQRRAVATGPDAAPQELERSPNTLSTGNGKALVMGREGLNPSPVSAAPDSGEDLSGLRQDFERDIYDRNPPGESA